MAEGALEIDLDGVEKAKSLPAFGDQCWLTFSLAGSLTAHDEIRPELEKLRAKNLTHEGFAFVNAKIPVVLKKAPIVELIEHVQSLCLTSKIEICGIDLDSSLDDETSSFIRLT